MFDMPSISWRKSQMDRLSSLWTSLLCHLLQRSRFYSIRTQKMFILQWQNCTWGRFGKHLFLIFNEFPILLVINWFLSYRRGDSMPKIHNFGKFSNKKFLNGIVLVCLSHFKVSLLGYTSRYSGGPQTDPWSLVFRLKYGLPGPKIFEWPEEWAAGRRLCIMDVGKPQVTQSAVKSLASSGPFKKFRKNWTFFEMKQ